ncbi:tyrosine-type recombinase/integrase [Methylococcus mesophilus]|uniref:tyrosine-type recombinase/integrase n=1 Tax=Methylococcus mesophilus TaxID=2993564 RepID=UPI00224A4E8B|nr:site-specific integrase [Methylococcus mesophilus]UZR29772.1 tyrosine-type recombinase/integrase [Methylococcus mesophilus]
MARAVRSTGLESRTARLKLEAGKRHALNIGPGASLVYRRGKSGAGAWFCRVVDSSDKESLTKIGPADDYADSDDVLVLNFSQAQARCREISAEARLPPHKRVKPLTVAEAAEHYMGWFRVHRKSFKDTERTISAHILPKLGAKQVHELTVRELRKWHEGLCTVPPRKRLKAGESGVQHLSAWEATPDNMRARKSTANRVLTVLKAILNKAFQDGLAVDDSEWRRVKPFGRVDEPVIRFLSVDECTRLVNACPADFRQLVRASLLTGARYGELARMMVGDFHYGTGAVRISGEGKTGRARWVPLNEEGQAFFLGMAAGKLDQDLLFMREDRQPWGSSHQCRRLADACKIARIEPAISFHDLRHSYASLLAQAGADLLTISKLLGHADTRITSRHYAHLCDRTLAAAVQSKLPSFGVPESSNVVTLRGR